MNDTRATLLEFVAKRRKRHGSEWLTFDINGAELRVYMRCSMKIIDTLGASETLDMASANAEPTGTGAFTAFVAEAEGVAKGCGLVVFAQCVHNERLAAYLLRRGYKPQYVSGYNESYWL